LKILIPRLTDELERQLELFSLSYRRIAEGYEKELEPVILSINLYRELYELGGVHDPYRDIKEKSILAAEKALPLIEASMTSYSGYDHFKAALSASIAGNLIDFNTAYHSPDLTSLAQVYETIMREGFEPDDSADLWQTIQSKKGKVVFLADNAGETHFDIPLLRILKESGWRMTYVVKGQPMINDATREDIKGTQIEDMAEIADNGGWAHGVPSMYVSKEFLDLVKNCDLVLSKGQANVETFPEIQREIGVETFYIIRAKCPHIAQAVGANVGDNVVLRRPAIRR
jgi:uncharacterized protein with ATP-grasp and redox domains